MSKQGLRMPEEILFLGDVVSINKRPSNVLLKAKLAQIVPPLKVQFIHNAGGDAALEIIKYVKNT